MAFFRSKCNYQAPDRIAAAINQKIARIAELEAELKERPPKDDMWTSIYQARAERERQETQRALAENLRETKFRLEEVTAHRDHLVKALEDKQQELADCRAKRKAG